MVWVVVRAGVRDVEDGVRGALEIYTPIIQVRVRRARMRGSRVIDVQAYPGYAFLEWPSHLLPEMEDRIRRRLSGVRPVRVSGGVLTVSQEEILRMHDLEREWRRRFESVREETPSPLFQVGETVTVGDDVPIFAGREGRVIEQRGDAVRLEMDGMLYAININAFLLRRRPL